MNTIDLNERVAELAGWKKYWSKARGEFRWRAPDGSNYLQPLDYQNDLNACAKFIATIDPKSRCRFTHELLCICVWTGKYPLGNEPDEEALRWGLISATPSQLCEAFIKYQTKFPWSHA